MWRTVVAWIRPRTASSSLGRWARYPARAAAARLPRPAGGSRRRAGVRRCRTSPIACSPASMPEHVARAIAEHHVIERVVAELAASGALDDAIDKALASPRTTELVHRIVASAAMQQAIRDAASSPEVRTAMREQTIGHVGRARQRPAANAASRSTAASSPSSAGGPWLEPTFAGVATRGAGFALDLVGLAVLSASSPGWSR